MTLQELIKKHGLPEPDEFTGDGYGALYKLRLDNTIKIRTYTNARIYELYISGVFQRRIESDSDWQAVSTFLNFIRKK